MSLAYNMQTIIIFLMYISAASNFSESYNLLAIYNRANKKRSYCMSNVLTTASLFYCYKTYVDERYLHI